MRDHLIETTNLLLEALKRKSVDRLAELYAEDAVYEGPGAGRLIRRPGNVLRGREEILLYWKEVFRRYPDYPSWGVRVLTLHAPLAILEYEDHRQRFCDVLEIHGEAITAQRSYWGTLPSRWVLDELERREG